MNRRDSLQTVLRDTLVAAKTSAGERVYLGRVRPFDPDSSSDIPPAICVYVPAMEYKLKGIGPNRNYNEDLTFTLELWAKIDPGRLRDPKRIDELQERAINTITQQAIKALFSSDTFLQCFDLPPDVRIVFGMDLVTENRVGAAIAEFTGTRMRVNMLEPSETGTVYDDLKQIWVDTDITDVDPDVDLPMTDPDFPDLAQDIPDLDA